MNIKTSPKYKILIFAPAFAPMNNPEAVVNGKLALAFLRQGWEVDIISNGIKSDYQYTQEIDELWGPLNDCTYKVEPPVLNRLFRYIDTLKCFVKTGHPIEGCRWAYSAYIQAISLSKDNKYDFILSRAMPENAHLAAMLFSKKSGIPWIANWNDPHTEKAPLPWENIKSFSFIKNRYSKAILNQIKWHTFPSEKLRIYMSGYLSSSLLDKSSVFPHIGLDYKITQKQDSRHFAICYSGALYQGRDPSTLFSAVSELISESDEIKSFIKIVLLGKFTSWIYELITKYNLEDYVIIEQPKSYLESLDFISKMDLLFLLEANYSEGIFLPSKMVDYYQVNRPILAMGPPNSEVQGIVNQYGGGVYISYSERDDFKGKLFDLFELWKDKKINSYVVNSTLSRIFDPHVIIKKYEDLFDTIIKSNK
jgi:hypothetical protein